METKTIESFKRKLLDGLESIGQQKPLAP